MTAAIDPAAVAAAFTERFGREPLGVWSAPGRVNLIGEHTDYNDGFVLPFAIDRRTVAALAPRADGVLRVASSFSPETVELPVRELAPDRLSGWSAYVLGVAWALGEHGASLAELPGADILIDSDVPVGAGLSSSAAIESAVAVALDDLWELGLDRRVLAQVGRLAENRAVGAPTGIMDQTASLRGEADAAVFLDCRTLGSEVVPLRLREAGLSVLVMDTRVQHAHSTGGYASRRASCERAAAALGVAALRDATLDELAAAPGLDDETLRRARHVVTENARVLETVEVLRSAGSAGIGALLDASHASMRDDFEISTPELDLAVEASRAAGAIGARMTGGGFGGAAIALVPTDAVAEISARVAEAFAARGFVEPDIFTVTPSDGARREL